MARRFWLKYDMGDWKEVSKQEFIAEEKRAKFTSKFKDETATLGFSRFFGEHSVHGKITDEVEETKGGVQ